MAIVIESACMWPELPADCPCAAASEQDGTYFRLVDPGPDDWKNHVQVYGEEWCVKNSHGNEDLLCGFHALSVLRTVEHARAYRDNYGKLRNKSIAEVAVDRTMGRLHEDKPKRGHSNWWPHGSAFVPPPGPKIVEGP